MRKLIALVVIVAALCIPAVASASSAAQAQYSTCHSTGTLQSGGSSCVAQSSSGSLPFTGLDLLGVGAVGVVLLGGGLLIRHRLT